MLIINFVGGLGNQMFQYAMGKAMALRSGKELRFDTSIYNPKRPFNKYYAPEGFLLKKIFGINENKANAADYVKTMGIQALVLPILKRGLIKGDAYDKFLVEKRLFTFDCNIAKKESGYLYGHWQSEEYFADIQEIILSEYEFNTSILSSRAIRLAKQVRESESVSLHVRGTDYLTNSNYSKLYNNLAATSYYVDAISRMRDSLKDPKFYIFTDDPDWVSSQELFKGMPIFSSQHDGSWNDLYIMHCCKNHITANSTFSWWSAWLSKNENKIVLTPRQWFIDGTKTPNLLPKTWIKI